MMVIHHFFSTGNYKTENEDNYTNNIKPFYNAYCYISERSLLLSIFRL